MIFSRKSELFCTCSTFLGGSYMCRH
ncbi:SWIM zinc finger family protein [Acinetobacter sp. WCHAc060042]